MALDTPLERFVLSLNRKVSVAMTPFVDGLNHPPQARTACLAEHPSTSFASPRQVEREPEEVEGRLTLAALLPLRRTPERQKSRLVGTQGRFAPSEKREAIGKIGELTTRFYLLLYGDQGAWEAIFAARCGDPLGFRSMPIR